MNPTVMLTAASSMFTGPSADVIAWTLIHFFWQGALLGLAARLVMRSLSSASARYLAGVVALTAMPATAVATFAWLAFGTSSAAPFGPAPSAGGLALVTSERSGDLTTVTTVAGDGVAALPLIVLAWLVGVGVLSLRLAGGFIVVRRLAARAVTPVDHAIEVMGRQVADRLELWRTVRIVQSEALRAPVLIGWLKPVVLLPAAALSGLAPAQLEALIAHELAHVKRHDYLVNVLQSVVETLLFYHPAVWWLSREIRREREHCCDDLAVGVSDRVVYASALTELAAIGSAVGFALGATDGPLLRRVSRILSGGEDERQPLAWIAVPVVGLMLVLIPAGVVLTREPEQRSGATTAPREPVRGEPLPAPGGPSPTTAARPVPDAPIPIAVPREQFTVTTSESVPLEQRLREVELALELLAEQRHELDAMRIEAETSVRRQSAGARVEELQAELKRLNSQSANADARARATQDRRELAQAEAELRAFESEAEFRKKAAALAALERKQQREHGQLRRKLEAAQMAAQARLQREIEAQAAVESEVQARAEARAEVEAGASGRERLMEKLSLDVDGKMLIIPPIAPAGATARSGDVVTIDIEGESGLPRGYPIQADGTIRLPLIGPVSVDGLTPARIQDVVTKELSDRRLAAGRSVTATLHRPR
jgi:beta-lactamase regulating signal transducer with metallopeptidase domain